MRQCLDGQLLGGPVIPQLARKSCGDVKVDLTEWKWQSRRGALRLINLLFPISPQGQNSIENSLMEGFPRYGCFV